MIEFKKFSCKTHSYGDERCCDKAIGYFCRRCGSGIEPSLVKFRFEYCSNCLKEGIKQAEMAIDFGME